MYPIYYFSVFVSSSSKKNPLFHLSNFGQFLSLLEFLGTDLISSVHRADVVLRLRKGVNLG